MAAITKDTASVATQTSGSSITLTLTVASNSNRILIAVVTTYAQPGTPPNITSVKWNGTDLTHLSSADAVSSATNNNRSQIWYLINPETGSHNLVATFASSASDSGLGAWSLYNVNQTTGVKSGNGAAGSGGTAQVSTTPTVVGSWLVAGISSTSGVGFDTDTQDWHNSVNNLLDGQHKASPTINSSNTMGWGSASAEWACSSCEVLSSDKT